MYIHILMRARVPPHTHIYMKSLLTRNFSLIIFSQLDCLVFEISLSHSLLLREVYFTNCQCACHFVLVGMLRSQQQLQNIHSEQSFALVLF